MQAVRPLPDGYPTELETVGDHIRKRRMDLGLFQREVADILDVQKDTVRFWEKQGNVPEIRLMPSVLSTV
jgi:DNA-binding XRE family transcriptional regulator